MDDHDWQRLIGELQDGDCTPFVGAGASNGVLPTGRELSEELADEFDYPSVRDRDDLLRIAQYGFIRYRDPLYVRRQIARRLRGRSPDLADPYEPHVSLARFPLPVYLTTNYDTFMADALTAAGKDPRPVLCPWFGGTPRARRPSGDPEAAATAAAPVVYHLHGHYDHPHTMVLAEQDYLEFLVNLSLGQVGGNSFARSAEFDTALTQRPLLFVGYSLHDWTFRVLFLGLLAPFAKVMRRRHISIQLEADPLERAYLTEYFHEVMNVSVYWGEAGGFFRELHDRLDGES